MRAAFSYLFLAITLLTINTASNGISKLTAPAQTKVYVVNPMNQDEVGHQIFIKAEGVKSSAKELTNSYFWPKADTMFSVGGPGKGSSGLTEVASFSRYTGLQKGVTYDFAQHVYLPGVGPVLKLLQRITGADYTTGSDAMAGFAILDTDGHWHELLFPGEKNPTKDKWYQVQIRRSGGHYEISFCFYHSPRQAKADPSNVVLVGSYELPAQDDDRELFQRKWDEQEDKRPSSSSDLDLFVATAGLGIALAVPLSLQTAKHQTSPEAIALYLEQSKLRQDKNKFKWDSVARREKNATNEIALQEKVTAARSRLASFNELHREDAPNIGPDEAKSIEEERATLKGKLNLEEMHLRKNQETLRDLVIWEEGQKAALDKQWQSNVDLAWKLGKTAGAIALTASVLYGLSFVVPTPFANIVYQIKWVQD